VDAGGKIRIGDDSYKFIFPLAILPVTKVDICTIRLSLTARDLQLFAITIAWADVSCVQSLFASLLLGAYCGAHDQIRPNICVCIMLLLYFFTLLPSSGKQKYCKLLLDAIPLKAVRCSLLGGCAAKIKIKWAQFSFGLSICRSFLYPRTQEEAFSEKGKAIRVTGREGP
jgi:hypothetical protein